MSYDNKELKGDPHFYCTNRLDWNIYQILSLYARRWRVDVFYRDSARHDAMEGNARMTAKSVGLGVCAREGRKPEGETGRLIVKSRSQSGASPSRTSRVGRSLGVRVGDLKTDTATIRNLQQVAVESCDDTRIVLCQRGTSTRRESMTRTGGA